MQYRLPGFRFFADFSVFEDIRGLRNHPEDFRETLAGS